MGLISATTIALMLWIVLWALGYKAIDGFMFALVIILVAVTVRMLSPYAPGNRD